MKEAVSTVLTDESALCFESGEEIRGAEDIAATYDAVLQSAIHTYTDGVFKGALMGVVISTLVIYGAIEAAKFVERRKQRVKEQNSKREEEA